MKTPDISKLVKPTTKDQRLEVRLDSKTFDTYQEAADIIGMSLSAFIRAAVLLVAENTIKANASSVTKQTVDVGQTSQKQGDAL